MNNATIDFIKQWLAKADEDLLVVERLTDYEIIATSSVCFHCQQAVEKSLKALIANGVDIKKTHNTYSRVRQDKDLQYRQDRKTNEKINSAFVSFRIHMILSSSDGKKSRLTTYYRQFTSTIINSIIK